MSLLRALSHSPLSWLLMFVGGATFTIAATTWWRGLLTLIGAMILNVMVSLAVSDGQKKAGEID